MPLPPPADLAIFAGLVLVACLHGLTIGGQFPAEHRKPPLRGPLGSVLLWGSVLVTGLALAIGLVHGLQRLSIPVLIIAGGAAALFTPLLLRPLPDSFVDGRGALLTWAGLGAALAALALRRLA